MSSTNKRKSRETNELDQQKDEDDIVSLKNSVNKKRKRIILSSDEEDETIDNATMNDQDIPSISEIKKSAKIRAKKLTEKGGEETELPKKTKTPPSKPGNSIMNYFRPLNVTNKITEPENKAAEKNHKMDNDGFQYTVLKDINKISPKEKRADKDKLSTSDSVKDVKKEVIIEKVKRDSSTKKKIIKKEETENKTELKEKNHKSKVVKESPEKGRVVQDELLKASPRKAVVISKSPRKKFIAKPEIEVPRPKVEPQRVSELLVDKYKPNTSKQVIGQQGDRSPMNKLKEWLKEWYCNLDSGNSNRAALLSGPPGIGKTTTAQLVCKELGYDFLELNASDTRNKKSLQENLNQLLGNTKLTNFFKPIDKSIEHSNSSQKLTSKHCVIMDEVDGMAGNEDRGGVSELIQCIKKTKVPLICICNDRNDAKIRSLANYCLDLRFNKPRMDQIKAALMSIVFKEKINITSDVLDDLISSSNFDIRQCIHNLSMLAASESPVKNMINQGQKPIKDVKLGPFEAIKKVFATGEDYALMSFNDKSDLFFCDYGIMPLFVYENYLNVQPIAKDICSQLKQVLKTINAISTGDIVEKEVRTNQNWSLLPMEAAFATVMPGAYMRSATGLGFPQFPQYMGKLSTLNKNNRLVDELMSHMALSITGSRSSLSLDYLEPLRSSLVDPLLHSDKDGIPQVLETMEKYSLLREDMTTILELSLWKDDVDPFKKIDTKIKSALTKECKKGFILPYATSNDFIKLGKKKGKSKSIKVEEDSDEAENSDFLFEEEEEFLY